MREVRRNTEVDKTVNAMVGLGCLVILFKFVALAAIVFLVYHAINSFS